METLIDERVLTIVELHKTEKTLWRNSLRSMLNILVDPKMSSKITLSPDTNLFGYEDIVLTENTSSDLKVVGELIAALS